MMVGGILNLESSVVRLGRIQLVVIGKAGVAMADSALIIRHKKIAIWAQLNIGFGFLRSTVLVRNATMVTTLAMVVVIYGVVIGTPKVARPVKVGKM